MRKSLLFAVSVLSLLAFSMVVNATGFVTDTVGGTSDWNNWDSNIISATPINATSSGNLSSIGFNFHSSDANVVFGIYNDSTGAAPDALLNQSAETYITGDGWHDLSVTGMHLVENTTYWIIGTSNQSVGWYTDYPSSGLSCYDQSYSYSSSLPNPFGSCGESAGSSLNARMTYVEEITTTTLPPLIGSGNVPLVSGLLPGIIIGGGTLLFILSLCVVPAGSMEDFITRLVLIVILIGVLAAFF
jgi:hypothetical protein